MPANAICKKCYVVAQVHHEGCAKRNRKPMRVLHVKQEEQGDLPTQGYWSHKQTVLLQVLHFWHYLFTAVSRGLHHCWAAPRENEFSVISHRSVIFIGGVCFYTLRIRTWDSLQASRLAPRPEGLYATIMWRYIIRPMLFAPKFFFHKRFTVQYLTQYFCIKYYSSSSNS